MLDDTTGTTAEVWGELAALGATGVLVPQDYGGSGMTMVEAGIVATELGAALRELGRPAEAERCLREALRLRPDAGATRVDLGNALLDLGLPDEAEGCFRDALRGAAGPHLPVAHLGLGVALGTIGKVGLVAMGIFLAILVVGFIYEWKKGALEWD